MFLGVFFVKLEQIFLKSSHPFAKCPYLKDILKDLTFS